jgi:hypothetical protein
MMIRLSSLRAARAAALAVAVVFAAGCGDDDSTGTGNISTNWEATVTGGSAGTYSGLSSATVAAGSFNLGFATLDQKFALAFTRSGTRPTAGTYNIVSSGTTGFIAALTVNQTTVYGGTGGTLTITSSTASEIKGSFDITMKLANGTTTNTVKGSFTATCPIGC